MEAPNPSTECTGQWRTVTIPRTGTDEVLRCDGCGDYWVIPEDRREPTFNLPNPDPNNER